jgi:acetyl esterase
MKARIYRPTVRDAAGLPTVLFIHGGGWVIGSVETHDNQARNVCALTGSVVVSIDYRLAPETRWPGPVEDCWAGMQWVADNVAELGGDSSRLAICGDSAGGNLAAVVAQMAKENGLVLRAQMLIYPSVDADEDAQYQSRLDNATGYFLTAEDMMWFAASYLPQNADKAMRDDPRVSPLRAKDLSGLAPAVILTAEYDPLRDEGEAYAAALEKAGVEVRLHRFDGMIHGFFDLGTLSSAAAKAVQVGCEDFAALLSRDA